MKLVNLVEQYRYKKEIVRQISEIAPELLTTKNIRLLVQKLYDIGVVYPEEKTYFEVRLQAKLVCLLVEKMFAEYGWDVNAGLILVDKEDKSRFGKTVFLSCPHFPEEIKNLFDEKPIDPFGGVGCRSLVVNKIVECRDIFTSPLYNEKMLEVLHKYGIQSAVSFPIHFDENGSVIGTLVVNSRTKLKMCDEIRAKIVDKLEDLEHVFTGLNEAWKNKDVIRFKGIMSPDCMMVYIDPEVENAIGFTQHDIIHQMHFNQFTHPDDRDMVAKQMAPLKEGKTSRTVYRCLTKDGSYKVIQILTIPVKETDGTLRYYENHVAVNSAACKEFESKLKSKSKLSNGVGFGMGLTSILAMKMFYKLNIVLDLI